MSSAITKPHHIRREFCHCRKAYREGREPKAVKVYTVAQESNYLIVQGIPALGLLKDLIKEFMVHGAINEYRLLDDYPAEEFTEVLLIKFVKMQSARLAKRKMDNLNYCGGQLHIFYAPEYETIDDTRSKLQERRGTIAWRLRLLKADSDDGNTVLSAPVDIREERSASTEDSGGTLNVTDEENRANTTDNQAVYIQPMLLPPPPVAIPTLTMPPSISQLPHQNYRQPFVLTNYPPPFIPTSTAHSFSEVLPPQHRSLVPVHQATLTRQVYLHQPPPDGASHQPSLPHVLPHHPPSNTYRHPNPSNIALVRQSPLSRTPLPARLSHHRPMRPMISQIPQSIRPPLPSSVDSLQATCVVNSRTDKVADEDYLGSRVERVPTSCKLRDNAAPVIKTYTHVGSVPRFVPRQLVKRQVNAKDTAVQRRETPPDPVNEKLKKIALALGSTPQGPALPPEEEQKRRLFRSSETGDASLDETVAIIREKVSQTTSVAPPTKKLKRS